MDLKLVVLCAMLFMDLGASGAVDNNLATNGSLPKGNVQSVAIGNDTQKCDSLQLAKTYTSCSMPFYADFISNSLLSSPSSCSPLTAFQACLRDVLEKTACSNDTALLTPTINFFTSNILASYEHACKNASENKNLTLVATSAGASDEKNLSNGATPSESHGASTKNSLINDTTAAYESNGSSGQTRTIQPAEANKKSFVQNKPASDDNSDLSKDMTGVTSAADNASSSGNQSSDGDKRKRMADEPCVPKIDTGYKYPVKCDNRSLLRRMFTCGVTMHEFILHGQDPCKCFMNYRECVDKARTELKCDGGNKTDDPILVTVKLIESLMLSWYQNPCAVYSNSTQAARSSLVSSVVSSCDVRKGSIASVVCYATYLAMTDLKTPAPWTSYKDACSAVVDAHRCLMAAEHTSNCTNIQFTGHSRKFLKVITSGKDLQCPEEIALPNVQALSAYVKPGCMRSKALKRALRCSLSFQDMADTEHEFSPSQAVPCGHVSRLHTCLEDSVEGTGCYGDINVHSEIKLYKKVLEDAYDVRCLVEGQPETNLGAKNKHILRPHARSIYNQASGSSGLRNWRIDLGLYDKNSDNVGYYYDDSAEGHKPVFAGPRIIAMHPDDTEYNDYDRSDTLYQKAHESNAPNGWRPLAMRLEENASTASKAADAAVVNSASKVVDVAAVNSSSNDTSPQTLLQFFKPDNPVENMPRSRSGELQKVEQIAKKPHGKKATGEDDYFFGNDYVENSELAMFPNGLDMFRHFRGGALAKMEHVVAGNKSELGTNDCPVEKIKLALGLCNATLRGLLLRWPNVSDVGLPLDGSNAGVKQFCSDLNSYRGCLAAVLKAYNCSHMQSINGVFEAYRKKMRLPYCASSGTWTRATVLTLFFGLLANFVRRHV